MAAAAQGVHRASRLQWARANVRSAAGAGVRPSRRHLSCRSAPKVAWLHSVATSGSSVRDTNHAQLAGTPFDAVIMLAGGLTETGGLPEWVSRRLDTAHDVHLLQQRRPPVLCLGGGTPHKPAVMTPTGHVLHESSACATYLMGRGMEAGSILKEVSSFDTVGNAFFSLTIHAIPAGWRRVAVVTSAFHMPRSAALFSDLYALAGAQLFGDPGFFDLTFVASSDEGVFDDYVLAARHEKEAQSLADWESAKAEIDSLAAFHRWFYSSHLCYAVPRQNEFGRRTIKDERLLASY